MGPGTCGSMSLTRWSGWRDCVSAMRRPCRFSSRENGAMRTAECAWVLDRERRTVDDLFETQEETNAYIKERKDVLEEITGKPVRAYRAGAFSAQPGQKLLRALAANGILIDSSVV